MPNWITITADHLKAAGHGAIIDRGRTLAVGSIDPVNEAITGATSRVRRAISTGNQLDLDTTKVPDSLREVCIRIALYALMRRIGLPLSEDDRKQRDDDTSDLKRISDDRIRVEVADTPDAEGEMQPTPTPQIHRKHRDFTRRFTDGI